MMELAAEHHRGISFLTDRKYRLHRHVALQLMIFLISISVFFDKPDTLNLSFNRFCGWITYYLFMNMLVYVNVYVLFPYFMTNRRILQYTIAVLLFTIFSMFIMVILQDLFYDIAVSHQKPDSIAIFLSVTSSFFAILLFMLGMSALLLFKPLMQSHFREKDLQKSTTESKLQFLKSQINPHFLFNTINNANILIEDEPLMAAEILTKLDDLLRYQWKDSHREKVYLMDDIGLLTDYLDLEKIRRDEFYFCIQTQGNMGSAEVAPLLFIPFVENAIKHNIDSDAASYVNLVFSLDNDVLIFTCENSKPVFSQPKATGGIGLNNIVRRLDLLYKNKYVLEKAETAQKYTVKLTLKI
ncbi:sensor histidine kinase [Sphingobacterium sp. GVS05A]|uniref:sensor histidine kinase n=1 Tax=Sphingobacterium sp. GVS05A TaxID=2862679 RepID=UPI001CBE16EF|nr:histidine kinase [Sphingobacterium sp. GVS05A]